MSEYTEEEKAKTGNQMYGGKRHDELCDKCEKDYKPTESELNYFSMGVWQGIESEKAVQEAKQYVPGLFRCAKCDLSLVASTLYLKSGGVGPNNSPQQCPNGCGPMWRVTWEQNSRELAKTIDNLVTELQTYRSNK